jgi:L-iditol 2-dehydrogenase
MTATMRAAVLTAPRTIEIQERPLPVPATGEVLIKISQAGICGGDLQAFKRTTPLNAPHYVVGHEACGVIADPGASSFKHGLRVVFDPQVFWCGVCEWCQRGHVEVCSKRRYLGAQLDGTFAEYVAVPADRIYPIPASMSWEEAVSVHGLAGTVFAVQKVPHGVGETVAILGPGAAGLLFTQLEKNCFGAGRVILAGRSDARLKLGRALGADDVVNTRTDNLVVAMMDLTKGRGADIIIETTGSPQVRQFVPTLAAPRGRVLSYAMGPIGFDGFKEMTIYGSTGAPRSMQPSLDLISSGRVRVGELLTHRFPIDQTQHAFETALSDSKGNYVKGSVSFDS